MVERQMDVLDSNNGSGMELADSDKPVNSAEDTTETEEKPIKTLTQRMMAIRAECAGIGKEKIKMKTKTGSDYTIDAHTIEGVLHGVRTLFDKHGVFMLPNLVSADYNGNRCDVKMEFHFENVDDKDDRKMLLYAGSGTDNNDKGFAKAGTNALKEMLKKVFLITDREDAKEETDQVPFQTNEGATREEVEEISEEKRAALEQWANALRDAIITAPDIKTVNRLQRDNKTQLMNSPPSTRSFFIDIIERRKKELKAAE